MRAFFTNLLAMCNMQPAQAKACEFCGGVKCFGACGAESSFDKARNFCGRLVPGDGYEGCFACNDGKLLHFRRDSKAGRDMLSVCPDGVLCRIAVSENNGVITAFFSVERL